MKVSKLLESLQDYKTHGNNSSTEVVGITEDSRKIKKGFLFVAVVGFSTDGHRFISQAIDNGASVIVGESDYKDLNLPKNIMYVKTGNTRSVIGLLAAKFFGNPDDKLKIIGVTGTDGKTTTSTIIYSILTAANKKTGLLTTVGAKIGDKEFDTGFHVTSPDPVSIHESLSEMVAKGCKYAVLEVTSHGLDQHRFSGVHFDIAVLTNITHEHLDYHKTYENYVRAKGKLFGLAKTAIINKTDESYNLIKKYINPSATVISYDLNSDPLPVKSAINSRFSEEYNRFNATAAYLACKSLGVSDYAAIKGVKKFAGIQGRMEEIKNNKGLKIIVDFAHTPNALKEALTALSKQKIGAGRLIAIFGCASERDDAKRPMMAEISTGIADVSVFTAEDPRREDINKILMEMESGAIKGSEYHKIGERGEAISFAINKIAKKGDMVVICGKGHEKSMAYNGVEYPWSDHKAVDMALKGKVLTINHT